MSLFQIHLIGPKDKTKWNPIWNYCFKYWDNSKYPIQFWNDENIDEYLKNDDLDFFNKLNQLPDIYKYDYIRYLILRDKGGAYFDLDVEIIHDFLPILDPNEVYLLGGSFLDSYVTNAIMISPPNLPMWVDIIRKIKSDINNNLEFLNSLSKEAVLHVTGPDALSKYIALGKYKINILSHLHFGDKNNNLSFSKHHLTNSWH